MHTMARNLIAESSDGFYVRLLLQHLISLLPTITAALQHIELRPKIFELLLASALAPECVCSLPFPQGYFPVFLYI